MMARSNNMLPVPDSQGINHANGAAMDSSLGKYPGCPSRVADQHSEHLEAKIDRLAEQLQAIKDMLALMVANGSMAPAHTAPSPMGPSATAFLMGGVDAVKELNKQRVAAQRAAKAEKRRALKGGRV